MRTCASSGGRSEVWFAGSISRSARSGSLHLIGTFKIVAALHDADLLALVLDDPLML